MKKVLEKRPRGRPPTGRGEGVLVRFQPDLLSALDKLQEAKGAESRAAAIRQVLTEYLRRRGFLK